MSIALPNFSLQTSNSRPHESIPQRIQAKTKKKKSLKTLPPHKKDERNKERKSKQKCKENTKKKFKKIKRTIKLKRKP